MNHKGSLNLLALKGAQILNVTMPNGRTEPCIVIPAAYNDMLRPDKNNAGMMRVSPYVNFRTWPPHPNYIEACNRNHAGEPDYVAPSHNIKVSFSEEFRARAAAAAERRIRKETPNISDADLKKAVSAAINITLGDLTPVEQERRGFAPAGTATATAPDPSNFQDPQSPSSDPITGEVSSDPDDLPF